MAFHRLTIIGKLVSDPKSFDTSTGGKVAKFGLPVNFTRPKKNPTTGEWEGESFIINIAAFNRDNGFKLADFVLQYLKKGSQVYVEGRLKPNEYTDKTGTKNFRPEMVVDTLELLDGRETGGMSGGGMTGEQSSFRAPQRTASPAPARKPESNFSDSGSNFGGAYEEEPEQTNAPRGGGGTQDQEDIPF